jgi:glycosyltransferase involved in cell wall biosynthesis
LVEANATPKSRRLVVIVPWLQGGGAQAALVETIRILAVEEISLVVCFTGNRNTQSAEDLIPSIVFLNQPRTPVGLWRASREVSAFLRSSDVVYSLMRGSHVVLGLLSARQLRHRPLIATFHQLPSIDAHGRLSSLENVLVRRAVRSARLITAPSERALVELRAARILSKTQGVVSPNPIRRPALAPVQSRPRPLNSVRLLFAGRLDEQKGVDLIEGLLAASRVQIHLTIAGEGPMASHVEALAAKKWIHTVRPVGHVSDIFSAIDDADFILLPSRFELNPVIVWEAWARGRAVLSSRAIAFEDLAKQGPVLTFGDAAEFRELLASVAAEPDVYYDRALRAAGRLGSESPLMTALREGIRNA